ncbi:DUF3857 domain-containing protein [Hymenobacter saemangeumensis]|uniref:DUF3857 domain-containing protein n=1 Tax=Hymenobacter saemangeumensis TaxID=1084522 RepID=UPI0031E754D6
MAAQAQNEPAKFGKLDAKDLTPAPFLADSAAEAVMLSDYGTARVDVAANQKLQLVFERTTRIKILKKSGFDWATVEVPLANASEKMSSLRGFTYNLVNGQVVKDKLESDGKYFDDVNKRIRIRKFTMPNVREGSVIEFSYSVVSENFFNLPDWQFQHTIPVRWSEYRASYPEYFDYRTLMQGYLPLSLREQSEGSTFFGNQAVRTWQYRWAMKNVPAFVPEPFITTARDFVARLDFELAGVRFPNGLGNGITFDWARFDRELLQDDDFGQQLDRGGFLKEALAKLPATTRLEDKVAAIRTMVQQAVKYNEYESIYTTAPLKRTFTEVRQGNAADINLLLIAALRAAQIEANPVLLSTRDHGRLNEALPLLSRFNYVVAHVALADGKDLFVDATDPLLPSGALPERCLSYTGRLLLKSPGQSRWIEIKPSQRRVHYQQARLTLSADGSMSGTVREEFGGYTGAKVRAELQKLGDGKYRSQFAGQHSSWTLPKFTVLAREELAKPLALEYEFSQAGGDAAGGSFYLSLLDGFGSDENPFRLDTRTYPVDFGTTQEETIMMTLTLPAGYELSESPKAAVVDLPEDGGRFMYSVTGTEGTVQLTSRMYLRKPMYAAAEYEHLREFYRLMLAKQAEKLVIRKKA